MKEVCAGKLINTDWCVGGHIAAILTVPPCCILHIHHVVVVRFSAQKPQMTLHH